MGQTMGQLVHRPTEGRLMPITPKHSSAELVITPDLLKVCSSRQGKPFVVISPIQVYVRSRLRVDEGDLTCVEVYYMKKKNENVAAS